MTPVVGSPKLTITKALTSNADGHASGTETQGDVRTYTVTETNTGNIALANVVASDALITPNSKTCASVAVGGTCVLVGTYTVTAADVAAGSVTNNASVTSTQVPGPTAAIPVVTPVVGSPKLTITKALTSNADGDGSGTVTQGDVLTYTVTTNTEQHRADQRGGERCADHAEQQDLRERGGGRDVRAGRHLHGDRGRCHGRLDHQHRQRDQHRGAGSGNCGDSGGDAGGGQSEADDHQGADVEHADGDASGTVTQGDVLTYTVTVTNTGNIALTNVVASDALITPNSKTCASVAVGGTCVLVGTYTVTAADVTAGSITNTASVTSTEVPGPTAPPPVVTPVVGSPKLTITKALTSNADGDASGTVTQGDVLTYTVTVTNTGNIALTNVVASDALITPNSKTCASVAVGGTCVLVGTYTVTAADVAAGSESYQQRQRDQHPSAGSELRRIPVVTPVVGSPKLTITKALTSNADGDASGTVTQGDVLTYTVTVTNAGNGVLSNVVVSDALITPNSKTCASVAVGGTCVLVGTYTVTAADVAAGSVTNNASVTSTEVPGPTAPPPVVTPVVGSPKLTITKALTSNADGDASGTVTQGDVLTYTVTVNNTGSIALTNVVASDALDAPNSKTCASVAVGGTCVLVGTYTVSAADVAAGSITNTASVTSTQVPGQTTTTLNTPVLAIRPMSIRQRIDCATGICGRADRG